MPGAGSNKPIVFVFGAKKGDAESRKKNLSAINTQVAYRAHERRREKKSKQRAQAKEDGKVDQPQPSSSTERSTTIKVEVPVDFNSFIPVPVHQEGNGIVAHRGYVGPQHYAAPIIHYSNGTEAQPVLLNGHRLARPPGCRRGSDLSSEVSSDHDAVWSNSPSSYRYSTPGTDMSSSPLAPVQVSSYFDSALDPFFRLPGPASDREKWLVHFCE